MDIMIFLVCIGTLFLAYANGANDNFKGVATLLGSGTTDYRKALAWATVTTFAGSLCSFMLAKGLVKTFSGQGLVPDTVVDNPVFLASVIIGAALTVFMATKTGMPISTTHSLTGALFGAGMAAAGSQIRVAVLLEKFLVPLLLSPFIAAALASVIYPLFCLLRKRCNVTKSTCVCIGEKRIPIGVSGLHMADHQVALSAADLRTVGIEVDDEAACRAKIEQIYSGTFFGVGAQKILDALHFLSAGAVSFARGLNDTPKIIAMCLVTSLVSVKVSFFMIGVAIALGGILSARKVADTMSNRITVMNHGQGFTANVVTQFMVIFASRWGVPVSTTHVSCGSLFGIGAATGQTRWKTVSGILAAWVLTLPCAALTAAVTFLLLQSV